MYVTVKFQKIRVYFMCLRLIFATMIFQQRNSNRNRNDQTKKLEESASQFLSMKLYKNRQSNMLIALSVVWEKGWQIIKLRSRDTAQQISACLNQTIEHQWKYSKRQIMYQSKLQNNSI